MLVLKWLKINCLMLYIKKNKCLVLSKYPHSDPLICLLAFLIAAAAADKYSSHKYVLNK